MAPELFVKLREIAEAHQMCDFSHRRARARQQVPRALKPRLKQVPPEGDADQPRKTPREAIFTRSYLLGDLRERQIVPVPLLNDEDRPLHGDVDANLMLARAALR